MTVDELEREVRTLGFRHDGEPKNPKQIRASIAAMPHKNPRVRRVGPGTYGLTKLGEGVARSSGS